MTLNTLKVADAPATIKAAFESNQSKGVQLVANTILNPPASGAGRARVHRRHLADARRTDHARQGAEIYGRSASPVTERTAVASSCPAPLGNDPRACPRLVAPRLGHQDYVIKTLLHGLTGPVNGTTYTEVMVPMGQSPDDWIAAIASYVRNSFGNRASIVAPADVARVRAAAAAAKQVVDDRGAGGVAAQACTGGRLEADGEPQPGDRVAGASASIPGRQVTRSSRACGSRSSCRSRRC